MSSTIYETVSSLHHLAKFFGIYLFTLNPVTFLPELTILDLIFTIISICFYGLIFYIHFIHAFTYMTIKSKIIEKGIPVIMSMHFIFFTTIILLSNIKRRDFGRIMKKLSEIDKTFEYFDVRFDYRLIGSIVRRNVIKLMIWIATLLIIGAILAYKVDNLGKRNAEHIFFFWCLSIGAIVLMSFKFTAVGIGRRFQKVNEILR